MSQSSILKSFLIYKLQFNENSIAFETTLCQSIITDGFEVKYFFLHK